MPLSRRDISDSSLTRRVRRSVSLSIVIRKSCCVSFPHFTPGCRSAVAKPLIEASGVRNSWNMMDNSSVLSALPQTPVSGSSHPGSLRSVMLSAKPRVPLTLPPSSVTGETSTRAKISEPSPPLKWNWPCCPLPLLHCSRQLAACSTEPSAINPRTCLPSISSGAYPSISAIFWLTKSKRSSLPAIHTPTWVNRSSCSYLCDNSPSSLVNRSFSSVKCLASRAGSHSISPAKSPRSPSALPARPAIPMSAIRLLIFPPHIRMRLHRSPTMAGTGLS